MKHRGWRFLGLPSRSAGRHLRVRRINVSRLRLLPKHAVFLLIAATALVLSPLVSTAAAVFTVNSTGDASDTSAGDGVCDTGQAIPSDAAECTLRAAIEESNANIGKDTIAFDLPVAPFSIAPDTQLPTVTDPVVIDGTTQPGWVDVPIVELRRPAAAIGIGPVGLTVAGGDSTIRGLVINSFHTEIQLETNGNNIIAGNFIGTDVTGTQDGGGSGSNDRQLFVASGDGNRIGGTDPADRNVIAGLAPMHILVRSSANVIEGNFIGTDVTGTMSVGSNGHGVSIEFSAMDNVIGGNTQGAGNLISGNMDGILVAGPGTVIQGNLIGTDVSGTDRVPNVIGIELEPTALATRIGGLDPLARNVISGNTNTGIFVESDDAIIQGNLIGPDISGTKTPGTTNAPGNGSHGIATYLSNNAGNLIGGTDPRARNVISGNGEDGIILGFEPSRNRIKGNFIGTDVTGTQPLGNQGNGIVIGPIAGGIATDNVVGGAEAGAGNVVAYNRESGVVIGGHPDFPSHNSILGNSIHSNGILGIDLVGSAERPDPNDPGDADMGANDLQNFPVLDWTSAGNQTTVTGTLNSEPSKTYRIEFFHNRECNRFPSEFFTGGPFGQGETFLGAIDVETNAGGDATIPATTFPVPTGVTEVVTATATNANGSTSEFSECRADLEITKSDDPDPVQNGQTLTYTIDVVNQGPSPALNVVVDDRLPSGFTLVSITPSQGRCFLFFGPWRCELGLIARYGQATITITGTVNAGSPLPKTIINTAVVSSELTDPDPGDNTATAETQVVAQLPELTLDKTADVASYDGVGDVIGYSYLVTNTGSVPLAGPVSIDDDVATDESCPNLDTVGNLDGFLDPDESISCTASHTITQADLDAGSVTNTATATADGTTSNQDTVTVTAAQNPELTLDKTADVASYDGVGDVIGYSYLVTNTGSVPLAGPVSIDDDVATDESCPNLDTVGNLDSFLDPDESITCTASHTITQADLDAGSVTNTATATADGTTSNQDTVTVTAVAGPGVSQITPTGTTCSQFASGTAPDLPNNEPQYSVKGGKIHQVNPGVFFYWVTVEATSGQDFTVVQTISSGNFGNFFGLASGSFAYTPNCQKIGGAVITQAGATTTVNLPVSASGTIIIGIKYDATSVKGALAPNPPTVTYEFSTTGLAGSTEVLNLQKK